MEYKNLYIYIPREKILNFQSRNHQKKNTFTKLFYYVKKKQFQYNESNICEIDIFDIKEVQKNTFYKDCFNSSNNEFFDVFYKLKPKFNNLDEIYVKKKKKLSRNDVFQTEYSKKTRKILNNYELSGISELQKNNLETSYKENIKIQRRKLKDFNKCRAGLTYKRSSMDKSPLVVRFD